jgi:hypothetical protein
MIIVGVAGCFAALSVGRNALARGSVTTHDIAGGIGGFIVVAAIVTVLLGLAGRNQRR